MNKSHPPIAQESAIDPENLQNFVYPCLVEAVEAIKSKLSGLWR